MKPKNVTIYDIAKESGVSPATVSRVLTNKAKVSPEKKERVQQVIDKYNFKPNALAKGLSNARRQVIGMITADIRNPFYSELFVACELAADRRGYTLLVCDGFSNREREKRQLEKLAAQKVDAIIQIGGAVEELVTDFDYVEEVNQIANDIPIVINGSMEGADCYQVNIDHCQGIELAVEHLMELGHRKIALIGGSGSVKPTVNKHQKFRQLTKRYMLDLDERFMVINGDYNPRCGYNSMKEILEGDNIPTAVIAINDFVALGVISAITEAGLNVPKDISVVGFDNSYLAGSVAPSLTSIDYDYELVGEMIVDATNNAIERNEKPRIQEGKVRLVKRSSTGVCKV